MKLVIKTNVQKPVKKFIKVLLKGIRKYKIPLGVLVVIALMYAGAGFYAAYQPVIRDFVVANVAHVRAGEIVPFTEEDLSGYTRGLKVDKASIYTYGIESNNIWMAEYVRKIVPFMSYEHAAGVATYPKSAGSIPFPDKDSFHVGGRMLPSVDAVLLNERYFIDAKWNDKRNALSTLVHELVHIQRGAYITGCPCDFEPPTVSATAEILAAMCNYGDQLACDAFWNDIEHFARSSLLVQTHDLGVQWMYDTWARVFWRDQAQQDSYLKSMRFWAGNEEGLMDIRRKYALVPWRNIIYGVAYNIPMNTGHVECINEYTWGKSTMEVICGVIGMPFDDARYLMQDLVGWLK